MVISSGAFVKGADIGEHTQIIHLQPLIMTHRHCPIDLLCGSSFSSSFPSSLTSPFPSSLTSCFPSSLTPYFPSSLTCSFPSSLNSSFPSSLNSSFPSSLNSSFTSSLTFFVSFFSDVLYNRGDRGQL